MYRILCLSLAALAATAAVGCGGNVNVTGSGGSAGAGGSSGAAGSSAGGSSGAGGGPQCTDPAQCTLVNNCCDCVGLSLSEGYMGCDVPECKTSVCSLAGIDGSAAQCQAGQCVAGFVCDAAQVACNGLPPSCPAGQTPSVKDLCWGPCVPATECETVGSCDQCGAAACVTYQTQAGPLVHCVAAPATCNGAPTCACMGSAVCVGAYNQCADTAGGLDCSCPDC